MRLPLLVAPAVFASAMSAAEIHVAITGDDGNAGTVSAPLRSLQAAAAKARAGDTVTVHGGTWRETVIPAHSGEKDNPIVFQVAPGETAIIDGTEPVNGWQNGPNGVAQAPMAGDWFSRATPGDGLNLYDPKVHNQADQVFVDGTMVQIARWPNNSTQDPSFPTKAVMEKFLGKERNNETNWTTGSFEDAKFDLTASSAVGAQVMIQPNWEAWSWLLTGHITSVEGSRVTFTSRSTAGKDNTQGVMADKSRYFIFDKLELLDAPGEWFHDKKAGVLYLMSPDGRPLEGRVTAKKREFAFDLTNRSFITIRGFTIHACTITTDRDSGGDNVPYDDLGKKRYPWRNPAIKLPEEPFHQIDRYKDAPSEGIVLENLDAQYISHFTDVSGHFECQWGQSSGIVLSGRRHRISGSRIRYSAGNGIVLLGREHRALGNLIEDVNYAATDCGAIHTGTTYRCSSDIEMAWNTVRRTGRSGLMNRHAYRSDSTDGSDWKGRLHHNDVSVFGIQDYDLGGICATGMDGRYVRIDHNFVHDAYETPDNVPGSRAFTAGAIYLDYCRRFVVDHNVAWNVEWAIHLQNELDSGKQGPAGYVILNNSVAVKTLGGGPSRHGPYGIVRNSKADLKESVLTDNVVLLTDSSTSFKAIDFESDSSLLRTVDNNLIGSDAETLKLTGGPSFPDALVPHDTATLIINKAPERTFAPVDGLALPPLTGRIVDLGALPAGTPPWKAGHEAWPAKP